MVFIILIIPSGSTVINHQQYKYKTKYTNIEEALRYRESILSPQTLSGKAKEIGKTAGFTIESLKEFDSYPEASEALSFLDAKLAQESTTGKYEKLKEFFSGNA